MRLRDKECQPNRLGIRRFDAPLGPRKRLHYRVAGIALSIDLKGHILEYRFLKCLAGRCGLHCRCTLSPPAIASRFIMHIWPPSGSTMIQAGSASPTPGSCRHPARTNSSASQHRATGFPYFRRFSHQWPFRAISWQCRNMICRGAGYQRKLQSTNSGRIRYHSGLDELQKKET